MGGGAAQAGSLTETLTNGKSQKPTPLLQVSAQSSLACADLCEISAQDVRHPLQQG